MDGKGSPISNVKNQDFSCLFFILKKFFSLKKFSKINILLIELIISYFEITDYNYSMLSSNAVSLSLSKNQVSIPKWTLPAVDRFGVFFHR